MRLKYWGGQAANALGTVMQPRPLSLDAEHNILGAMVPRVEDGVAPSTTVGVKDKDKVPANGVVFTRPYARCAHSLSYYGCDVADA